MIYVTRIAKIAFAGALATFGGTSMAGAETLPQSVSNASAIVVDGNALHAGDEASLNDRAVEIVEPGYTPSPDPMLADEIVADPLSNAAPAVVPAETPAVATVAPEQTRTAARMISSPQVQDVEKTLVAQKKDDPFVIKSILEIDGPIKYGEWFWDDEGVPSGPLVMTVDYDNAPMPWSLRLTWSGIMIHGSLVENGYASHGCVGVPDEFAEKLFNIAKLGDKVIITRGETAAVGDKLL